MAVETPTMPAPITATFFTGSDNHFPPTKTKSPNFHESNKKPRHSVPGLKFSLLGGELC
jgi:hypothetical protein